MNGAHPAAVTPSARHPERQNAAVRRFGVELPKMCDKSCIFGSKRGVAAFGISYGVLMAMEQHSLPCVKGSGTRQRDGGIVEIAKTIPHPLRGSPLYTKGPAVDHRSLSAEIPSALTVPPILLRLPEHSGACYARLLLFDRCHSNSRLSSATGGRRPFSPLRSSTPPTAPLRMTRRGGGGGKARMRPRFHQPVGTGVPDGPR